MKNRTINLSPSQLLVFVFLFFISVGTVLLKLPFSTVKSISWIDALFTVVSAMTVTGLNVVDTGTTFTFFGQIVIIALIQLGGLGIMSFAILVFIMLGKKISFKQRLVMQQALNQVSVGGVIRLVRYLFIFSLSIELIAMIFLSLRWIPEYGWGKGLYYSFFHSISAFNNSGFSLFPDNLSRYVGDPVVNIVITMLIITGGLGFTVLVDLKEKHTFSKLTLHSKMMIIGTIVINVIGTLMILVLEYSNAKTIGHLSFNDKVWASYFQTITARTAGFNTIDIGGMNDATLFFMVILMFIGAGSGSTGGGIKLTTFIVLLLTTISFLRGRQDIQIFKKSIPATNIWKVISISMISSFTVVTAILLLNIVEDKPFLTLMFEVVSAFGTVGVTMGITASLTFIGKLIIISVMFIGKIGPLSIAFLLAKPQKVKYKYSGEEILTG